MGCHTWYEKPLVKGKAEVIKYLRQELETFRKKKYWTKYLDKKEEKQIKYIENLNINDNEDILCGNCSAGPIYVINGEIRIYTKDDELDIDNPRIGGYPETIIKSVEEMFSVMENGINGYKFHCEGRSKHEVKRFIIKFFKTHPEGIITFG